MIIFGGTQHFWYLQVLLNFKDDHVWICVTTEIQFATDYCSGSGLCTVRGNLKFYIFGDNLQLWYLPMSNLIISPPKYQTVYLLLSFSLQKYYQAYVKQSFVWICTRWQKSHLLKTGICYYVNNLKDDEYDCYDVDEWMNYRSWLTWLSGPAACRWGTPNIIMRVVVRFSCRQAWF